MKKLLAIVVLGLLFGGNATSNATPVQTTWVIEKYLLSGAFLDGEKLVGKTQRFHKGLAEGAFFNCNNGGLNSWYATYSYEEFFNNKQFEYFLQNKSILNFPTDKKIYVEKLTCADNKSVLFPFIQFEDEDIGFYEFDNGFYQLRKK
mgnify:FL=1